jgi:hypothetical protein
MLHRPSADRGWLRPRAVARAVDLRM